MKRKSVKIIISLFFYILAVIVKFPNKWGNFAIFVFSYLIVGIEILKKAIKNVFRGKIIDENFLMTIATIGAFAIGEYSEAVAVMLFYQIGELFQNYAVDKSRKSIASLMDIRPDYANVEINGKLEKVDPDDVEIGQIIVIKPGEKVPLDGIVIEGKTNLDTMALTGEAVPRKAEIDDEVLSGCINKDSLIKVKVTKEYGESTVSKILDLVENASNKKSKSENFITKFAQYYTPIVVVLAIIIAVFPTLVTREFGMFSEWLYRALSFLVVSCPCALVISIPLSFFGGIGGASKLGILVKGSNYLEAMSKTEVVVFDKTGTLTEGVFKVQKIETEDISKEELLKIVAYAERYSNHPIAESIKKSYNGKFDDSLIKDIQELSGKGVKALIDDKQVLVGNEKMMNENHIKYKRCDEIGTILYVSINNRYSGYILIADKIKKDSIKVIQEFKRLNIKQTVMLTGDKKEVGEDVARKIEINKVYTELLPDGKVKKVEELINKKSKTGKLVFVGDGINDAPVLAIADVGIAMGGVGADAAIEAADIVIMTDEPSKIGTIINLSKKTMRIVNENIIFAIFVKIVVLVLTAFGLSTMWEAVFADVGVSIIAIINSLRMLNVKKFN